MARRARNTPNNLSTEQQEGVQVIEDLQTKYERNKKTVNTVATVVLLAVIAGFAYFKFYKAPREEKGMAALNSAQQYYAMDSLDRALNGDAMSQGYLKIIKKYSGTNAENIAHYYAGLIYLKKGDPKNAIKHLEDFDGKGTLIEYVSEGALGDAYLESGNVKAAIEHYNEASDTDNDAIAALYLERAGMAYEKNNQPAEAIKSYKKIRDNYPQSMQARDMDKTLARLGELE